MDMLESMNRAIDYIEERLTGEIELGAVAKVAGRRFAEYRNVNFGCRVEIWLSIAGFILQGF